MSEHTKGKWEIDKELTANGAPIVVSDTCWAGNERQIAKVLYHIGSEDPEVQANARLIAAAPDLLEACKNVANMACIDMVCESLEQAQETMRPEFIGVSGFGITLKAMQRKCKEAIAKAEGS